MTSGLGVFGGGASSGASSLGGAFGFFVQIVVFVVSADGFKLTGRISGTSAAVVAAAVTTASPTDFGCLFGIPLVGSASLMGGSPAFGGDFAAFLLVHARETSTAGPASRTVFVRRSAVTMRLPAVAFGFLSIARLVMTSGLAMVMRGRFVIKGGVVMVRGESPSAADLRHVLAVSTHRFASSTSGFGGLFRVPLMRIAALMRRSTASRGDLALFFLIHSGKASSLGHGRVLLCCDS